jgi:hypothetical protein
VPQGVSGRVEISLALPRLDPQTVQSLTSSCTGRATSGAAIMNTFPKWERISSLDGQLSDSKAICSTEMKARTGKMQILKPALVKTDFYTIITSCLLVNNYRRFGRSVVR